MDVSKIGVQNPYAAAAKMNVKRDRSNIQENNATQTNTNADVEVDISEEARRKSMELKEYGPNSTLKLDEALFSQEAREKSKSDFASRLNRSVEIDPFDNEFQILAVQGIYNDGTLEKFVTDSLDGKAKNASLVADELGKMIRGTFSNPNATVEERATNRETALRNAAEIANNYFDNPDEAKAFLDEINRFAENDILREKGYMVFDNSDMTPFKSYQSPVTPDGGVSWNAYAEKYGSASPKEMFKNNTQSEAFMKSINENSQKWSEEIIKEFDDNEKNVTDIINKIKESLDPSAVDNSLQRLLKAF